MNENKLDNLSDDDSDIYVNSVARLKALKKKNPPRSVHEQLETENYSIELGFIDPSLENSKANSESIEDNNSKEKHNRKRGRKKKQKEVPSPFKINSPAQIVQDPTIIEINEDLDDTCVQEKDDDNYEIDVKVLWRSQTVHRISLLRNDVFKKVFQYFANLENVPIKQILLMRKEVIVNPTDSPASINLSVIDILDGGVISADVVPQTLSNTEEKQTQDQTCEIKVQTSNKKSLLISLQKDQPFSVLIKECGQKLNVKESSIKLFFDGEQINETDTPESLELEEEACIDLRFSSI